MIFSVFYLCFFLVKWLNEYSCLQMLSYELRIIWYVYMTKWHMNVNGITKKRETKNREFSSVTKKTVETKDIWILSKYILCTYNDNIFIRCLTQAVHGLLRRTHIPWALNKTNVCVHESQTFKGILEGNDIVIQYRVETSNAMFETWCWEHYPLTATQCWCIVIPPRHLSSQC